LLENWELIVLPLEFQELTPLFPCLRSPIGLYAPPMSRSAHNTFTSACGRLKTAHVSCVCVQNIVS